MKIIVKYSGFGIIDDYCEIRICNNIFYLVLNLYFVWYWTYFEFML